MGCGTSKAVAPPTAASFATKPVPEKPLPKAVAEQEDCRRDTAPSPEAKPLVSNPSSHDAKMLLNDWSKPTQDRAHARIMSKSPAIGPPSQSSAPSKSRASGAGAGDDSDSSGDEGWDQVRHTVVHKDRHNNVVDHAMPGAVQEESLITMFRPKSAIRLDLD